MCNSNWHGMSRCNHIYDNRDKSIMFLVGLSGNTGIYISTLHQELMKTYDKENFNTGKLSWWNDQRSLLYRRLTILKNEEWLEETSICTYRITTKSYSILYNHYSPNCTEAHQMSC